MRVKKSTALLTLIAFILTLLPGFPETQLCKAHLPFLISKEEGISHSRIVRGQFSKAVTQETDRQLAGDLGQLGAAAVNLFAGQDVETGMA